MCLEIQVGANHKTLNKSWMYKCNSRQPQPDYNLVRILAFKDMLH